MTKTALITGASRGFGRALAVALSRRGWTLLITARDAVALETAADQLRGYTKIVAVAGDIAAPRHQHALAAAAARLGGLDVVINNAGSLGPSPLPDLLSIKPEALTRLLAINAVAQLAIVQAVAPHLAPDATIVNVTSDAAREPYPGWGGYGSSKAALEQLSAVLAIENPAWRVYWVDPGDMRTAMHQAAFPGEDISDRPLPEASVPGLLLLLDSAQPSGRFQLQSIGSPT